MTDATAKAKKWTDEAVATLTEGYDRNATDAERATQVETLMEALSKSKREVTGKLVHLGVYQKPEKAPAAPKDEGPTKKELLRDLDSAGFDSKGGEGATKAFLTAVLSVLA